jgi:prolyl oligopeptidase
MRRLLLLVPALLLCEAAAAQTYPTVRRGATVDTLHGVAVADPYRWLEDAQHPETRAFVEAQAQFARQYLDRLGERAGFRHRLDQVTNYPRSSAPTVRGRFSFTSRNSGLQNQSVMYVREGGSAERVLLDANRLSEDGTVAFAGGTPTEDGRFWAYMLSDGGSDWRTVRIRDARTGQDLPEVLRRVKFSGITWKPEGHAFYYSRYDAPVGGDSLQAANENQRIYLHRLGTPQSADLLIYARPDHPGWIVSADVSDDGKWLFAYGVEGTSNKTYLDVRPRSTGPPRPFARSSGARPPPTSSTPPTTPSSPSPTSTRPTAASSPSPSTAPRLPTGGTSFPTPTPCFRASPAWATATSSPRRRTWWAA